MEKHEKMKLQSKRPFIVENLKEIEIVVDNLYTTRTLSPYEKEDIESQRTSFNKVRILLDHLERKPGAYRKFLAAVWDAGQDDMVTHIDSAYVHPNTSGQSESTGTASSQPQGNTGSAGTKAGTQGAQMSAAISDRRNKIYPLLRTPHHGYALIINNKTFKSPDLAHPLTVRNGTEVDQDALEQLFLRLGFRPEIHKDFSAQKMIDVIKQFAHEDFHNDCDSFICVIMSHGEDDAIYGADGEKVKVEEHIIDPIQRCRSLQGKPKLFFLQACRGSYVDMIQADGSETDATMLEPAVPLRTSAPQFADILIAYPSARGFVSMRDPKAGTWFIQSLIATLSAAQMHEYHILELLTQVNDEVSQRVGAMKYHNAPQGISVQAIANFSSSLRKYLFFNPLK